MSDAPERIWWNVTPLPYSYTSTVQFAGGVEYVRADRIEDLKAKLAECEARLGKAVDVLQWQSDAIRKSISGNEVGRNRVLLNGVYHEGPVVNWVFEILTGFETINLTTLAELTGGKDE